MYIQRAIEDAVRNYSQRFRVVLLTGPRQCGKTTLLKTLSEPERNYVTLDDLNERNLAKTDPALFIETHKPPVLIDEIQYAPEILSYIKIKTDENDTRGAYWLTGSQMFQMMKGVTESLAGRVGVIRMQGLSRSEIVGVPSVPFDTNKERIEERFRIVPKTDVHEIYKKIFRGFMPELTARAEMDPGEYYSSYLSTYIERDIRDLSQVADELIFLRFLRAVCARTAMPLIYEEIARDAEISAPTVKRWVSILVSSGIAALVPSYHDNIIKRAVKMPRLHILDTGLCAHILKWNSPETIETGAMAGQFFESWVFSEIYKSYLNAAIDPPLFYFRDKQKNEVDLLLYNNGVLYPIEIKKTASPGRNDIKSFARLKGDDGSGVKNEIGDGVVLCMIDHPLPTDRNNIFAPAWIV